MPRTPVSPEIRFWAKVDKSGDCWRWTAFTDADGYGIFGIAESRSVRAHRFAYEASVGPIPDGLELDHLCHTRDLDCPGGDDDPHRSCVNPAHLEPVTGSVNIMRGRGLGTLNASREVCIRGHSLSGDNLYVQPDGKRMCRECKRARKRAQNDAIKAANVAAGRIVNAEKTHCLNGHSLSGDNLHICTNGKRHCRQCGRDRAMAKYYRDRAGNTS